MKIRFLHIYMRLATWALILKEEEFSVKKKNVYFRGTKGCVLDIAYALITSAVQLLGAI